MAASKKKSSAPKKLSVKGFGGGSAPKTADGISGQLLRDEDTMALAKWLEASNVDMKKVAVADFGGLRGVMALQDIAKGDPIIRVPSRAAVHLGDDGPGPELLALELLKLYWEPDSKRRPYLASLPPPGGPDLVTTDFFTEEELEMLQCPAVADETRRRKARCQSLYDDVVKPQIEIGSAFHGAEPTLEHLLWAVFVVVSRVLTVNKPDDLDHAKLLIPGIDMLNHRPGSPHVLRGRYGGVLEVLAGEDVLAGSQVYIGYMGGGVRSDRMVQDYGFLDSKADDWAWLRGAAYASTREALGKTSLADDERLLQDGGLGPRARLAVAFRMQLKRAMAAAKAGAASAG